MWSVAVRIKCVKTDSVPVAFREALAHAFRCKICHAISFMPPIILARCCTNIIACGKCVDTWYSGSNALTKNYPFCQHERGYAQTSTIHGFDELSVKIQALFANVEKASTSEGTAHSNHERWHCGSLNFTIATASKEHRTIGMLALHLRIAYLYFPLSYGYTY